MRGVKGYSAYNCPVCEKKEIAKKERGGMKKVGETKAITKGQTSKKGGGEQARAT